MPHPSIAVVIATKGRANEVAVLLDWLAQGTQLPDEVVVVGSGPEDWAGCDTSPLRPTLLLATQPGLPRQRNAGVHHLLARAVPPDVILFFDDDFRPHPSWLEHAARVFAENLDVTGLTGIVLRDGAKTAAITEGEATRIVSSWQPDDNGSDPVPRLYGCNMALRSKLFAHARFDERLPLYAWLEDLDFSGQISGRQVVARGCGGVHLGSKGARVSGRRYGYSQIVNPVYLAQKGTCPAPFAAVLVLRALTSNLLRSPRNHPIFDYRGRLTGNLHALGDLLRRKAAPERILEL